MEYLFFLLYPIFMIIAYALARRRRNQRRNKAALSEKVWGQFADELGLEFRDRGARDMAIEGSWQGYDLRLYMRTELVGDGRDQITQYFARATVDILDETIGWELTFVPRDEIEPTEQGASLRERFEARFTSSTASTPSFRALLGDEQRLRAILDLADEYDAVGVIDGSLFVERAALIENGHELRALLEKAIETTRLLDEIGSPIASTD